MQHDIFCSVFFEVYYYTVRGGNCVEILSPPFWKGVFSKRKEFAPAGSKFFPFREDPFSKKKKKKDFVFSKANRKSQKLSIF